MPHIAAGRQVCKGCTVEAVAWLRATDAKAVGIAYWQYIWRRDAVMRPHSPVDLEVHAQPGGEYTVMYAW